MDAKRYKTHTPTKKATEKKNRKSASKDMYKETNKYKVRSIY